MAVKVDPNAGMSVVTATHDGAGSIARAVRSVAVQSVPVHEHIIVDDGSTDTTAELVGRLQTEYSHIVYLRQEHQGTGVARNRGIEYATGRYVAFLDSDDWWRPNKVERQLEFMRTTGAVFTYGDYEKHDARTDSVIVRYVLPESLAYADLLGNCPIGCLTAAYDQQVLGKCYMPAVRRGQDWGLWLALTRDGQRAYKYPGNDAVYMVQPGSLSSGKVRKTVDVFRIYYKEERMGLLRSIWNVGRHVVNALKKR